MLLFRSILLLLFSTIANSASSVRNQDAPSSSSGQARDIVGITTGRQQCREHFTCLSPDRTIENLQYLKVNSLVPNWYEMCNCDSYCHLFGDCCSDAPILKELDTKDWTFTKIRLGKTQYMALMRSKCSPKWNDTIIRKKCEYTRYAPFMEYLLPEIEHLMLITPEDEFSNWHVTGRQSLVTYKNVYCAKCNHEDDVEAWTQRMKCKAGSIVHDKENAIDGKDYSHKCSVVSHQQTPDFVGREKLKRTPLQTKVWAQCSLGWYKLNLLNNPGYVMDTMKKCLIYYEPVAVQDSKSGKFLIFKNKYCSYCNDYDEKTLNCPQQSIDQLTQIPASFNVITSFDTNTTIGSQIDADSNQTCPPDSVFNPLIRNCQGMRHVPPAGEHSNQSPILDRPTHASTVGQPPNSSVSVQSTIVQTLFSLFFSFVVLFCLDLQ